VRGPVTQPAFRSQQEAKYNTKPCKTRYVRHQEMSPPATRNPTENAFGVLRGAPRRGGKPTPAKFAIRFSPRLRRFGAAPSSSSDRRKARMRKNLRTLTAMKLAWRRIASWPYGGSRLDSAGSPTTSTFPGIRPPSPKSSSGLGLPTFQFNPSSFPPPVPLNHTAVP
jgi:hypothetical protein